MEQEIITGKVIKIIDDITVVVNKGSIDGMKEYDKFLVYHKDEELFDPDTNESLGYLEIVCGEGKVLHMQDKITTIKSSKIIKSSKTIKNIFGIEREESTDNGVEEFKDVHIGCLFRIIK